MIIELQIFSPRWGHKDTYELDLQHQTLVISLHARKAKCTWRDGHDPEWSGEELDDILRNDSIYAPAIFQDLVEHAWKAWRNGELDDAAVRTELQAITTWLNEITERKPKTKFWQQYF